MVVLDHLIAHVILVRVACATDGHGYRFENWMFLSILFTLVHGCVSDHAIALIDVCGRCVPPL